MVLGSWNDLTRAVHAIKPFLRSDARGSPYSDEQRAQTVEDVAL